jgi:hypothetical protein
MSALIRPWKNSDSLISQTFLCVLWNLFSWGIVFAMEGKVTVNGVGHDSLTSAISAYPLIASVLLFPLIGVVMMYHCLARWMNKTEFKIEDGHFEISHRPIPWGAGKIKIPIADIKQAYVQQYCSQEDSQSQVFLYRLMVQRYSCGDMVLESGITLYTDAQKLEEWLEAKLQIKNESVLGEFRQSA